MLTFVVFLFLAHPLLSCPLIIIGYINERKYKVAYSFLIGGVFGYISYFIQPSPDIDLARYFMKLDMLRSFSLSNFLSYYSLSALLDSSNWFMFLLSKLKDNHILPLVTMWVVYTIVSYIVIDNAERTEEHKFFTLFKLICLLSLLPFPSIANNTRNIIAFAVFALAFYKEINHTTSKRRLSLLYLFAVSLHTSVIALLLLKWLAQFLTKYKLKRIFFFCVGSLVVIPFIVDIAYFIVSKFLPISFVLAFVQKAYGYVHGLGQEAYIAYINGSRFMQLQKIYFISLILLLTFLVMRDCLNTKKQDTSDEAFSVSYFNAFYLLNSALVIGTVKIVLPVYWRFSLISIILIGASISYQSIRKSFSYYLILFLFCSISIVYQVLLFSQFTDLGILVKELFTNNFISIFFKG